MLIEFECPDNSGEGELTISVSADAVESIIQTAEGAIVRTRTGVEYQAQTSYDDLLTEWEQARRELGRMYFSAEAKV